MHGVDTVQHALQTLIVVLVVFLRARIRPQYIIDCPYLLIPRTWTLIELLALHRVHMTGVIISNAVQFCDLNLGTSSTSPL